MIENGWQATGHESGPRVAVPQAADHPCPILDSIPDGATEKTEQHSCQTWAPPGFSKRALVTKWPAGDALLSWTGRMELMNCK